MSLLLLVKILFDACAAINRLSANARPALNTSRSIFGDVELQLGYSRKLLRYSRKICCGSLLGRLLK